MAQPATGKIRSSDIPIVDKVFAMERGCVLDSWEFLWIELALEPPFCHLPASGSWQRAPS